MPEYRSFFFDADNHIKKRVDFVADSDGSAIIEARAFYAESEYRDGFEIWERSRLVYNEGRATPIS